MAKYSGHLQEESRRWTDSGVKSVGVSRLRDSWTHLRDMHVDSWFESQVSRQRIKQIIKALEKYNSVEAVVKEPRVRPSGKPLLVPDILVKTPDQVYIVDVQVVSDAGVRGKLEDVQENKTTKYNRAENKAEALKMLDANIETPMSVHAFSVTWR